MQMQVSSQTLPLHLRSPVPSPSRATHAYDSSKVILLYSKCEESKSSEKRLRFRSWKRYSIKVFGRIQTLMVLTRDLDELDIDITEYDSEDERN